MYQSIYNLNLTNLLFVLNKLLYYNPNPYKFNPNMYKLCHAYIKLSYHVKKIVTSKQNIHFSFRLVYRSKLPILGPKFQETHAFSSF